MPATKCFNVDILAQEFLEKNIIHPVYLKSVSKEKKEDSKAKPGMITVLFATLRG
jgi:hypothetical protein